MHTSKIPLYPSSQESLWWCKLNKWILHLHQILEVVLGHDRVAIHAVFLQGQVECASTSSFVGTGDDPQPTFLTLGEGEIGAGSVSFYMWQNHKFHTTVQVRHLCDVNFDEKVQLKSPLSFNSKNIVERQDSVSVDVKKLCYRGQLNLL